MGWMARGKRSWVLGCMTLVMSFAVAQCETPAFADEIVGGPGAGAGQIANGKGIAVDTSLGLLYVADGGNRRIDVFDADTHEFVKAFGWGVADGVSNELQVCTTTCFKGLAGGAAGQFSFVTGVAVDNDPASPSFHSVYVADSSNARVQKFTPAGEFVWMVGGGVNKTTGGNFCAAGSGHLCGPAATDEQADPEVGQRPEEIKRNQLGEIGGIAVGPGGILHVGDQNTNEVGPDRKGRVQRWAPSGAYLGQVFLEVSGGAGRTVGVAVDSASNFYVGTAGATGAVRKYDASGACLNCSSPTNQASNISAIAIGLSDELLVSEQTGQISLFDAAGNQLRVFYSDLVERPAGVAPHPDAPDLIFVTGQEGTQVSVVSIPPPGPVVYPRPSSILATQVRSTRAVLHSRVNPEGEATTYRFQYVTQAGFDAEGGWSSPQVQESGSKPLAGSDFQLQEASQEVTGLKPETAYRFRVVATNADGTNEGPDGSFQTLDSVLVGDAWALEVGFDSATVRSQVNPLGSPATGYFEYVEEAGFQESGFATARKAPDLDKGANPLDLGSGEEQVVVGAQLTGLAPGTEYRYRFVATNDFKTVSGPTFSIRTFSAPSGPQTGCPNDAFRSGPSASLPDCRAYEMVSPLDKSNGDIVSPPNVTGFPVPFYQAATSGEGFTFSSYRAFGKTLAAPYVSQYLARRGAGGWETESITPPQGFTTTVENDALDNQFLAATPELTAGWFFRNGTRQLSPDAPEGVEQVYRRDNEAGGALSALNPVVPPHHPARTFEIRLQAMSGEGEVLAFTANDDLSGDASSQNVRQLYLTKEGFPWLASVLPSGAPSPTGGGAGGGGGGEPADALRYANLENALSTDASRLYWTNNSQLYLRENPLQEQSPVDSGQCTAPELACTIAIPQATAQPQFWAASPDGSRAIFSAGAPSALYEFDAETRASTQIAAGFLGVLGTGEDAERVYFASTEALAGAAQEGQRNVYLHEAGEPLRFVAKLGSHVFENDNYALGPFQRVSRVSEDGSALTFVSRESLTGYDNLDADTAQPAFEVFLYDAQASGGAGKVICASCNPTGARPRALQTPEAFTKRYGNGPFASAYLTGWTSALHETRALSSDGNRLFFTSVDALVARDTNGIGDVYQWEAPGIGSCTVSSPAYSPRNEGCVALISSGRSPYESEFIDATADGSDVFFTTGAGLLPQDYGLIDVYDARIGGGFPPPPPPPSPCQGDACQSPSAPPEAPTPASLAFRGPEDLAEGPPRRRPCAKGKVRRKGRCVKKKARGKHPASKARGRRGR